MGAIKGASADVPARKGESFLLRHLQKSESSLDTRTGQKAKARQGRCAWRRAEWARRKIGINKTAAVCVLCEMGRGDKGSTPGASCESGQALEKAQNGNGQLLEKVGMDLGLAPRPLGFGATSAGVGATSAWGCRRRKIRPASARAGKPVAAAPSPHYMGAPLKSLQHRKGDRFPWRFLPTSSLALSRPRRSR